MGDWWVRGRQESELLGPGYDIWLDIGDSNNHSGPSYDPLLDTIEPKLFQLKQNNSTIVEVHEPDVDHYDNSSTINKIGYGSSFFRDHYIPDVLASDRTGVLWIPRGIGGTGVSVAGARAWASRLISGVTLTNSSTAISFGSAHGLIAHGTQAIRMYVYGTDIPAGTQLNAVPTSTTGTLSQAFTGTTGTYTVLFRGAGLQMAINSANIALGLSGGTHRLRGVLCSVGSNDVSGENFWNLRVQEMAEDLRASITGAGDTPVPIVFLPMVPEWAARPGGVNSVGIQDYIINALHLDIENAKSTTAVGSVSLGENNGIHHSADSHRNINAPQMYAVWQGLTHV